MLKMIQNAFEDLSSTSETQESQGTLVNSKKLLTGVLTVGVAKYQFLHQSIAKTNAPPDPPDLPKVVAATAARTLPSTRARGQADGS